MSSDEIKNKTWLGWDDVAIQVAVNTVSAIISTTVIQSLNDYIKNKYLLTIMAIMVLGP
jgi:hypothetical protein